MPVRPFRVDSHPLQKFPDLRIALERKFSGNVFGKARRRLVRHLAAAAFRVEPPTVVDVVQDLVRKGWVTNRRSMEDRRVVCLRLSPKGEALVRRIAPIVQGVEAMLSQEDAPVLEMTGQDWT